MHSIRLFMWGYQQHFQISVQIQAAALFDKLDPEFVVQTFLVGLIKKDSTGMNPVCLEPEDCGWMPEDFSSVRKDAEHFLAIDGQHNLVATVQSHMDSIQARRRSNAAKAAVLKALNSFGGPNHFTKHYFSGFASVGQYDVGVVLTLTHRDGVSYYKLPMVHADDDLAVPTSILESSVSIFLREAIRSLLIPSPEQASEWWGLRTEEILRRAGGRLMEAPVLAAGGIEGLYGLFDACNYIASLNYEGAASSGGMIIAREDHPNLSIVLRLTKPVRLGEHRAIRKLLQVSSSGDFLVSNGSQVIAIGKTTGHYDQSRSDLLRILFTGHHKWELLHETHKLMEVRYGLPRMPLPALSEARFYSTCEILFSEANRQAIKVLYDLALEACRQRHGTVLIITPAAKEETIRLAGQVTALAPVKATGDLLKSVTTIDGAVMIDLDGVCHAIGAILDGDATPYGDPGRGARYNSSLRYCGKLEGKQVPCLAVIVSEDGTSELIPDLPRKLPRYELTEKEKALDVMLALSEHSIEKSCKLLLWLRNHRFYLSDSMCERANKLMAKQNEELQKCSGIIINYQKFSPNQAMSDAFLA